MLVIDETELISFFGVLPTQQDPEEKEFFGTTIFDIHQDGLHLSISFSVYHDDCYLNLKTEQLEKPLLELQIDEVREVNIKRDKPEAAPVLWIIAQGNAETREHLRQVVRIEVKPQIQVRMSNRSEVA